MRKIWMVLGSALLSISLTGCGANDNAEGNANNNNQESHAHQENRPRVLRTEQAGNQNLEVHERAEQHVERIQEVEDAHVIISNNDAYVSVRLVNNIDPTNQQAQQEGTGTRQAGTMGADNGGNNNGNTTANNELNGNNGKNDNKGNNENNQSFMKNGMVKQNGNNGIIDGKGDAGNAKSDAAGNGKNNNNKSGNNNSNGGNSNAYTANNDKGTGERTNRYTSVSNTFEQRIADQVRKADKNIHRVYVSVNPDFHNTMNTYSRDIRSDRDRNSLFTDFNNTVTNFFGMNNNND